MKMLPLNQLFFKKTKGEGEFQRLLEHLFKVNVEIMPLTGGWVYPKVSSLNQLGRQFVTLGRNSILGHRYYEPSLSVDAMIGPIDFECFFDIWKNHMKTIKHYAFIYLPLLTDVNFVFQIKEHEAKKAFLGQDLFLQINSWIMSKDHRVPAYDVKVFSKFEKAYNDVTDVLV